MARSGLFRSFSGAGSAIETSTVCKSDVADLIGVKKYEPTIHQPDLTDILPFTAAMTRRCPSFSRLLTELNLLMGQARRWRN